MLKGECYFVGEIMDISDIIARLIVIAVIIIVLWSGVYLTGCMQVTGLFWLLFIIIYYLFVMGILRALINAW